MSVQWFTTVADVYQNGFLENWQDIARIYEPIIAAVNGYTVSGISTLCLGLYGSSRYPPTLILCPYMRSSETGSNPR